MCIESAQRDFSLPSRSKMTANFIDGILESKQVRGLNPQINALEQQLRLSNKLMASWLPC